jgi:hypothetical protein
MFNLTRDSKTDYFRTMYKAHDLISDLEARLERLYASATSASPSLDGMPKAQNPQRLESVTIHIVDLKQTLQDLLKKRADFDIFLCTLSPFHRRVLDLRCENLRGWGELADELNMSVVTAKRIFKDICAAAEAAGLFYNDSG